MTSRAQILSTAADNSAAIFGLGINETDVLEDQLPSVTNLADTVAAAIAADVSSVTSIATVIADRLVTFVEGSIQPPARAAGAAVNAPYDTIVPVEGIETEDVIVSAYKVFVGYQDSIVAGNTSNVAELRLEDVTADCSVTDTDEVTFEDVTFEEGAGLVLTYVDVSRPDENE